MSPARPRAPAVLRLLCGLTTRLLLLLLLRPLTVRGDCGLPPDVPNAHLALGDNTNFPEKSTVTYKCNEGFVKVPGKPDSAVCLTSKWSTVAEFCNRSCVVPTRLLFASLKKSYSKQNYFPAGSTVEYECRRGYRRDHTLSGNLTCLQDFTWSKPAEFCKKKPCPNPGEIKNGHVIIPDGILFGASISFSCDTGYRLVGADSIYCSLVENTVGWSDPLPKCQEIFCPEPPEIDNGIILEKQESYAYRQSVKYKCMEGFTLYGERSIYCTVKDDQGAWSGPPPECRGASRVSEFRPTVQKSTTVTVPGTKAPSAPQKPTSVSSPATKSPPSPQKLTTVNVPATETPSTPRKHTTVNSSDIENPLNPQKHTTTNVPATETPSTPQKSIIITFSATKSPLTPQKLAIVNVPATETSSTPQKPIIITSSATKSPLTPQKPNMVNVPATEVPPTPQKPTKTNDSVAKPPNFPTPNTLSPAAQNPFKTNASATQAVPTTQKFTTAKASLTQNLRATRNSTALHPPVTKGFHTTQRLTSAHVTATKSPTVSKATTRFHTTSTSKGHKSPSSGASIIASGKFGSPAVKRNCYYCGMYHPYSWKRILSFKCLRNTIKMQCLRGPKRKQVNAFYRHVLWTPLGTRYVPKYSQPCSCSKVILGQLQIIWPINRVLLHAYCLNSSF
nr:complement decay-accelerating factor isoform X1 [Camelus dromedarius]